MKYPLAQFCFGSFVWHNLKKTFFVNSVHQECIDAKWGQAPNSRDKFVQSMSNRHESFGLFSHSLDKFTWCTVTKFDLGELVLCKWLQDCYYELLPLTKYYCMTTGWEKSSSLTCTNSIKGREGFRNSS